MARKDGRITIKDEETHAKWMEIYEKLPTPEAKAALAGKFTNLLAPKETRQRDRWLQLRRDGMQSWDKASAIANDEAFYSRIVRGVCADMEASGVAKAWMDYEIDVTVNVTIRKKSQEKKDWERRVPATLR